MARMTNPVAVAMKARYGRTTSAMKDRRAPRGGQRNEVRGWMAEWEDEQEAREGARAEAAPEQAPALMTDGDEWLLKRSDACP